MIAATPWLSALPPFLVAAGVCLVLVPVSMWIATVTGAVAQPDTNRHLHSHPTPRLGGIAMFGGFAVALAIFGAPVDMRWGVIAVCGAITAAMALDDIFDLPWWVKLVIEAGAGVAAGAVGILITFITLPTTGGITIVDLGWLSLPITVVWVMGMQVSINFLDGSDGIAAGVVAVVAMVCLLAAINRLTGQAGGVQTGVIIMAGALMGCCLAFLVFNLPPARTFMGDSGAHFLGVALAIITVVGVAKVVVALSLVVPLIALALPIGDTVFAIVRRRRAGLSPATPDAGHLHHRLRALGLSPMETAIAFYVMTAILGCIALAIFGHRRILYVALGLLVVVLAGLVVRTVRRRQRGSVVDDEGFLVIRGHRSTAAGSPHDPGRE